MVPDYHEIYRCERENTSQISYIYRIEDDKYLIGRTIVICGDDYVCFNYPDHLVLIITTKSKEELLEDDLEYTETIESSRGQYLQRYLSQNSLYSKEYVRCIANLYFDYDGVDDEPITITKMVPKSN